VKKLIALLLVLGLCVSFAGLSGCGSPTTKPKDTGGKDTAK
jgi:hypothetical protein